MDHCPVLFTIRKPCLMGFGLYYSIVALPISAEAPDLEGYMTRRLLNIALICTLLLLLLSSCKADTNNPVVTTVDVQSATHTAEAYLSDLAALAATAASRPGPGISIFTPTPTAPLPPTEIPPLPGIAVDPSTPVPSASAVPPTEAIQSTPADLQLIRFASCNRVEFVRDVSTPDNSVIPPGSPFEKTWRLQNAGTCTWTPDYQLVFVDGAQMQGQTIALPQRVKPGEQVNLTISLVAPQEAGTHHGLWMLLGPRGRFGLGQNAQNPFWVKIKVPALASQPAILNLAQDFCTAQWQTNQGPLDCPGDSNSPGGFALTLTSPRLESRNENEIALYTHPPLAEGSWISGTYPAFVVQTGDRFLADVGCLADFTGCQVEFMLGYIAEGAEPILLGQWPEVYDQSITRLEVDLSSLAGQSVQLILAVRSQGDAGQAGAFWLVPHISRQP